MQFRKGQWRQLRHFRDGRPWEWKWVFLKCHCELLTNVEDFKVQYHHAPGEEVLNRKDGGLLGGSLSVGSDRLISCASRWANQRANNISRSSHYLMNGLCYWRPTEQIVTDFVADLLSNHTIIPLRNKGNIYFTRACAFFCYRWDEKEIPTLFRAPLFFLTWEAPCLF